jgi:predicted phosphodiesterase
LNVTRQPNETLLEYQIRLCRDRELLNLTWMDVTKLLNSETGEDYTESKYRKWWATFREGFEYGLKCRLDDDEAVRQFEDKRAEFERERMRLADQKREYRNLLRQHARAEYICEELVKAVHKLADVKPIQWYDRPKEYYPYRESALILTDWHRGLRTENFWNVFNNEEFDRRVKRLVAKSIEYNHMNGVRTVHVFLNGDLIHGYIHPTSRIMSTEDVITQTMVVCETLAELLAEYANQFDRIKVYHVCGNHSRSHANKAESLSSENYERIIPWFLQTRLIHIRNIEFVDNLYDSSIANATICGLTVYALHGDLDKPSDVVQNITLMTGTKPDYVYLGHLHKYYRDEIHGTKVILSPALCGTEDYAKSIRKTSHAAQLLTIFDEQEGELCTYPIRLDIQ